MTTATITKTQEENLTVVRRALQEIWSEGQEDKIPEYYDSSYKRHDNQLPGISGIDGVRKLIEIFRGGVPDLEFELVEESICLGEDKVSAQYTLAGTHTRRLMSIDPTNRWVMVQGMGIWQIKDGKIVADWQCFDSTTFYQALGILPCIGEYLEDKSAK